LSKTHSINKIREWYLTSFYELTTAKEPHTSAEQNEFKEIIETIYNRHSTTLITISKGLHELEHENRISRADAPTIQRFLNRFHTNRTEIRILLELYMSLFSKDPQPNRFGIIHYETNLGNIIQDAITNIQLICDRNLIDIDINNTILWNIGHTRLVSIDHYLYYVVFELLKNSVQAVLTRNNPRIEITTQDIDDDWMVLKIHDNGVGIPDKHLQDIWLYSYSTTAIKSSEIVEKDDFSTFSPLSGMGYGLPISEIYINFLNSSTNNIKIFSKQNVGTTVYLYLRKYDLNTTR
jgi:pyruvate dehydrogenase kinase 2/3/4